MLDQILIRGLDTLVLRVAVRITPTESLADHVANQPHDTAGIVGQTDIEKLIGSVSGIALGLLKATERLKSSLRERFRIRRRSLVWVFGHEAFLDLNDGASGVGELSW
jgi:hypothetical protein